LPIVGFPGGQDDAAGILWPLGGLLSYDARTPLLHVTLIAQRGNIEIDGFARLRVGGEEDLVDRPASDEIAYHAAIRQQDDCFLEAIRAERDFPVPAAEMIAVSEMLYHAQAFCN
jgi:hypothetical protein